jgi:FdhD protein
MPDPRSIVPESVVRLEVHGRCVAVWTCTPERLDSLAAGRLLAAGYVARREDLLGVDAAQEGDAYTIRVRLDPAALARGHAEREHRSEAHCGLLHGLRCAPEVLRPGARREAIPSFKAFPELYRAFFAAAEAEGYGGGVHSAALSDGERLLHQAQEVGGHDLAGQFDFLIPGFDFHPFRI